jgi:hypothetical protein
MVLVIREQRRHPLGNRGFAVLHRSQTGVEAALSVRALAAVLLERLTELVYLDLQSCDVCLRLPFLRPDIARIGNEERCRLVENRTQLDDLLFVRLVEVVHAVEPTAQVCHARL